MKKIILSTAILLALFSCKTETKETPETTPVVSTEEVAEEERTPEQEIAYKIAEANGLDQWNQVSEVQFTFNVDRGEEHYEKSWIWKPKTQNITQMTAQDTITYNRSSVDSTSTAAL